MIYVEEVVFFFVTCVNDSLRAKLVAEREEERGRKGGGGGTY